MRRPVVLLVVILTALILAAPSFGTSAIVTADLGLAEGLSNSTPNVGDTITFTVTLTDHGPSTATTVSVYDKLPAGLSFVSATPSQGSYSPSTGIWTVGTISTTATLQVTAVVASAIPLANAAHIFHSDQSDPVATNNLVSVTEHPQEADLAVVEAVNHATPNVGDTITFTITITDRGPNQATNVTLTDVLPAGLSFVVGTPSQGSYSSGTGIWTIGTLSVSTPETLTIGAIVVSPNTQTNTPSVSHADQFDPATVNNHATLSIHPQQADLGLTQTVSPPTTNVGATVVFSLVLVNHGTSQATDVTVSDLLPVGTTFVSAIASRGAYVSGTGAWTVGTLAYGAAVSLVVHATLVSPTAQTITATITHSDQFDPSTTNNTSYASVQPENANLALSQLISDPSPAVGEDVLLTLTIVNAGPATATTVKVSDFLPVGLTILAQAASRGVYTSSNGTWVVGTLPAGGAATLAIHVRAVTAATFSNTATISHSDQFDPDTSNNTSTLTFTT